MPMMDVTLETHMIPGSFKSHQCRQKVRHSFMMRQITRQDKDSYRAEKDINVLQVS